MPINTRKTGKTVKKSNLGGKTATRIVHTDVPVKTRRLKKKSR